METSNVYSEDEVIDLKHFLITMAKKWKALLALALIGGILGLGIQLIPKEDTTRSKEDTELIKEMEIALQRRTIYERERAYISDSYLMQVDANNLYVGEAQYYAYDCKDADYVAAGFNAITEDETLRQQLCQMLGIADEKELDYFVDVKTSKITEASVNGEMQVEVCKKLNVTISVAADTSERAEQVLTTLKDTVDQKAEQLRAVSRFTMEMMSEKLSAGVAQRVQDAQSEALTAFNDAYDECVSAESGFSDEEYELYEEYFINGDPSELPAELFPSNPLKLPVIVAVVAVFLGCVWYACQYLFSGRIKTDEDLQNGFGIRMLAFIDQKEPAKLPLDRWLDKLELSGYPASVTADYAAAMLGDKKTAVLYCEADAVSEGIAEEMAARNANLVCLNFAGEDLNSLTNLQSGDNAVLLLRLDEARKVQVQQELRVCAHKGVQVIGAILAR